eukprot:gene8383-6051_t
MKRNLVCSLLSKATGRLVKERSSIPTASILSPLADKAYFYDCYACKIEDLEDPLQGLSPFGQVMEMLKRTPKWSDALMKLRNQVVSHFFGLKDLGTLSGVDPSRPLASYQIGERIGIFTLLHVSENQVVLGDNDKHLHVQVSLCHYREPEFENKPTASITTLVQTHNLLGKVYMFFVEPVHGIIAPVMLAQLVGRHGKTRL